MQTKTKTIVFTLEVTVSKLTAESEVESVINAALDEPQNDWGSWYVGAAIITDVK